MKPEDVATIERSHAAAKHGFEAHHQQQLAPHAAAQSANNARAAVLQAEIDAARRAGQSAAEYDAPTIERRPR